MAVTAAVMIQPMRGTDRATRPAARELADGRRLSGRGRVVGDEVRLA